MIRSRIRDDLERVRQAPFYPVVPLLPLALILGNLLMVGLILRKVIRIESRTAA